MSVDDDIKWLEDDMAKAVFEVLTSRTKIPYTSMSTFKYDPSKVVMTWNGKMIDPDCYGDGATIGRDKQGREYTEKLSDQLVLGDVAFSVFYSGVWSDAGPYEITRITGGTVYGHRNVGGQRSGEETRLIDHLDRMPLRVLYKAAAPKQQQASRWNGKCGRCGRGTYTGFSSVEHEGGNCAA